MTLLDEGKIVLNEEIYKHPVSKVHGGCEECQRLLTVSHQKRCWVKPNRSHARHDAHGLERTHRLGKMEKEGT